MKKTVQPYTTPALILATIFAVAFLATLGGDPSSEASYVSYLQLVFCVICLVVALIIQIVGKKIVFDENTFTVNSKTYNYTDITDVNVSCALVMRGLSSLRFDVYVGEERVAKFIKAQKNAETFVGYMKNHDVRIDIE